MHMMLLGETQLYIFAVEHEQLEREGHRRRLAAQARKTERTPADRLATRGFIPRLANALGLF